MPDLLTETAKHTIRLVAGRTGLTPAAIRAWERRYGAIRPSRSSTSRRLYTDQDVERLILLKRATGAGRRIGSVAALDSGALAALVREDEEASARVPSPVSTVQSAARHVQACLDAVIDLDAPRLESELRRTTLILSPIDAIENVMAPLLRAVGRRWRQGSLQICHEHLATSTTRFVLEGIRNGSMPRPDAPKIVIATPAGQNHELGALMLSVAASAAGWRVIYLGPNLPFQEISATVLCLSADVVALSLTYEGDSLEELENLRTVLPPTVTLLVGGRAAAGAARELGRIGATYVESIGQPFASFLDRFERRGT